MQPFGSRAFRSVPRMINITQTIKEVGCPALAVPALAQDLATGALWCRGHPPLYRPLAWAPRRMDCFFFSLQNRVVPFWFSKRRKASNETHLCGVGPWKGIGDHVARRIFQGGAPHQRGLSGRRSFGPWIRFIKSLIEASKKNATEVSKWPRHTEGNMSGAAQSLDIYASIYRSLRRANQFSWMRQRFRPCRR